MARWRQQTISAAISIAAWRKQNGGISMAKIKHGDNVSAMAA